MLASSAAVQPRLLYKCGPLPLLAEPKPYSGMLVLTGPKLHFGGREQVRCMTHCEDEAGKHHPGLSLGSARDMPRSTLQQALLPILEGSFSVLPEPVVTFGGVGIWVQDGSTPRRHAR